jgi:hypothetical protein
VITPGTLSQDGTSGYTAPGLYKWKPAASETPGVGCCKYRLYDQTTGELLAVTHATSAKMTLSTLGFPRARVEATDANGGYLGRTFAPDPNAFVDFVAADDSTDFAPWSYSGGWRTGTAGGAWHGTYHYTDVPNSTVTLGPELGSSYGIVATKGPNFGAFDVYFDGRFVKTVDTYAAAVSHRRIVFTLSPNRAGFGAMHTIQIISRGTPGRPTVRIDAVAVLASG